MKTDLFQCCGHCWVFQVCWHIECSTFTASSFRIWKSSTGIPSPPLALFIVMLPKAHLTSHSRMLALGEWSHHHGYLGHEDLFCTALLCILATSSYKIMASSPITSWQIDGGKLETVTNFIFLGSKITVDGDCSHKIKRRFLLGRRAMMNIAHYKAEESLCPQRSIQSKLWFSQ